MKLKLDDRMKKYEKVNDFQIKFPKKDADAEFNYFIIRLDGNGFSKRIKAWKLRKPFDTDFHYAMVDTCKELIKLVPDAKLIWTGSDEISIMCKAKKLDPWFNNRINKLISLAASYTTVYFNKFMNDSGYKVNEYPAFFDARIIALPDIYEVSNNILSRYNNCKKNSISMFADTMYSAKELLHKNSDEKIQMMKDKGFDWNGESVFNWSKYGTMIYKSSICFNKDFNEEIAVGEKALKLFEANPERYYIRNKAMYFDLDVEHNILKNSKIFESYFLN